MTQTAAILTRCGSIQVELPDPHQKVLPNVPWGSVDAFPSPAYWLYQVVARRLYGRPAAYRLGRSLIEELAACLLGGHGIPATVGIAAFDRLRSRGAFDGQTTQAQLETWLREPLSVAGREIRYRFAAQKAKYLALALPAALEAPTNCAGRELRDWLLQLPGVGLKTASWVARNWLDSDDVAILDIHIVRVGQAIGLFPSEMTVEKNYLELEALFLQFGAALEVRPSELDAIIWHEMASSPATVRFLVQQLNGGLERQHDRRKKEAISKHAQLTLIP